MSSYDERSLFATHSSTGLGGGSSKIADCFRQCGHVVYTITCDWFFEKCAVVLYGLASRTPYLAFVYSMISLPIAIFLFSFVMSLLGLGGFLYCICGVGIVILAFMSGFLKLMVFLEVLLARYLLGMKDTLAYPEYITSYVTSTSTKKKRKKKRKKKKGSNKRSTASDHSKLLNFDDETSTTNTEQHRTKQQKRRNNDSVNTDEEYTFVEPTYDSITESDSSTESEADEDIAVDPRKIIVSPNENQYYYQHYGTMMSRSLDGPSPTFNRPSEVIYFNTDTVQRTPGKGSAKKKTKTRTKKSASKQRYKAAIPPVASATFVKSSLNSPSPPAPERFFTRQKKSLSKLASKISASVFNSHTGFALLYTVVKLPISVIVFIVSLFLVLFPILLICTPIFHVGCKQLKQENYLCVALLDPSDFHNEWLPLISWSFWFINSEIGNVIACLSGIAILPVCIFLLGPVTKPAKDAVTLVGEDLSPLDFMDDED